MDFKPLESSKFSNFFDIDQRLINEHEFRKTIFKGTKIKIIFKKYFNFLCSWC